MNEILDTRSCRHAVLPPKYIKLNATLANTKGGKAAYKQDDPQQARVGIFFRYDDTELPADTQAPPDAEIWEH